MLKFGPLPEGDYTYLIRNGKITKYARWLLIATDLDLRFVELLLLTKIMYTYFEETKRKLPQVILREWLFNQFGFDFEDDTVRHALAKLKNRDLIMISRLRSVTCNDEKVAEVKKFMGKDFKLLHDYIDEIMEYDLDQPAC